MTGRAGAGRAAIGIAALALTAAGCGSSSSSSSTDAVQTALQNPGVRIVQINKQHGPLTVVIPPCSEAQVAQSGSPTPPPGSNQVTIPPGSLTETVAVQPCMASSGSSSSSSGGSRG